MDRRKKKQGEGGGTQSVRCPGDSKQKVGAPSVVIYSREKR